MHILTLSCHVSDLNAWLTEYVRLSEKAHVKITTMYERGDFVEQIRFLRRENIRPDLIITTGRCLDDKKRVLHFTEISGKRYPFMDPTRVFFDGPVTYARVHKIPLIHTRYGLLPRFLVKLRLDTFLSSAPLAAQ